MSATSRSGVRLRAAATVCSALVLAAGCAGDASPADAVPELRTRLSAVDQAIADHEFGQARREIQRLVRETVSARQNGDLDPDAAEPILAAAAGLVSALPRRQNSSQPASPQPQPEPDAGEQPPEAENGTDNDAEAREKRREELEKRREELEKRREELQKEQEEEQEEGDGEGGDGDEGGGNGDSGSNGPDDGHGN